MIRGALGWMNRLEAQASARARQERADTGAELPRMPMRRSWERRIFLCSLFSVLGSEFQAGGGVTFWRGLGEFIHSPGALKLKPKA